MEIVNGWLKVLQQWVAYASYCIEQPIQTPICKPFWTWIMISLFAFGAVVAIVIVWKVISYKLKLVAALRAQAERDRVDPDAIETAKWDDGKAYSTDEYSPDEIDGRVRNAVNEHRARNTPYKPDIV